MSDSAALLERLTLAFMDSHLGDGHAFGPHEHFIRCACGALFDSRSGRTYSAEEVMEANIMEGYERLAAEYGKHPAPPNANSGGLPGEKCPL